jgi:hypothetical protein
MVVTIAIPAIEVIVTFNIFKTRCKLIGSSEHNALARMNS